MVWYSHVFQNFPQFVVNIRYLFFCFWFTSLCITGSRFIHLSSTDSLNFPSWSFSPKKSCAATATSLQSCPTLCNPIDSSPPGSPVPQILQNTGVGCHFLLQCMKVKSESEVAQSCPTLSDPMDYSPPGSSIHGIFQARVLERGAIAFSKKVL